MTEINFCSIEFGPSSILMMDMEAEDIEEKILREHDIIFGNGGGGSGSDRQQGGDILAIAAFVRFDERIYWVKKITNLIIYREGKLVCPGLSDSTSPLSACIWPWGRYHTTQYKQITFVPTF